MADVSIDANEEPKNRPKATRLRQQKLAAWQPILTASTVIPAIFGIGIVFLPIGVTLYLASESVAEIEVDYTDCKVAMATGENIFAWKLLNKSTRALQPLKCIITVNLTENFQGDVYFYYALDNFYQNHRRYVKSRSDSQLIGNLYNVQDCDPYSHANESDSKSPVVAPCGAVANSMFNDTFRLIRTDTNDVVPLSNKGIIWNSDRGQKFRNPAVEEGGNLCQAFEKTVKPPNWAKKPCQLDEQDASNNGFENVDFIVWMRTAALPNYRKLYRRLNRLPEHNFADGLPNGLYTLHVEYNYPVKAFHGTKRFIVSTSSWMGSKNSFLGIAYMIVAVCCIGLGIVFIGIHAKFGKSLTEISNVRSQ